MAVVVVTAIAAVVVDALPVDVSPKVPASAPQAGSNASAVSEAVRPHNTWRLNPHCGLLDP